MDFLKNLKINFTLNSIICILLGVVFLIFPEMIQTMLVYAIAAVILLIGIICIISFIKIRAWTVGGTFFLVAGILLDMLSIWMFENPNKFNDIIISIIGLFILINGLMALGQATSLKSAMYGNWWLSLIFALATILFGLIVFCNPFSAMNVAIMIIGVILLYNGVSNVWIASRVGKYVNHASRDEFVDVDFKETDDN